MSGSIFIGLVYCIVSVGFSAGIFHYQTLAVDAFRERFAQITGVTVQEYLKAIPRFRKFFSRIPVDDGPIRGLGDGVRTLAGRPVPLTNERRWKIFNALQHGPAWRITEDTERRLLAVALYCANLPIKQPPPDTLKAKAFSGQRQAEFLVAQATVDIDDAQSVEELFIAYQGYRAVVRRKWFHALTGGHRKILKAKATPQVIFWKRILAYSGGGTGVGTLLFLCSVALRNDTLRHLPWPIIGGGIGLFLFAAGVVKSYNRGRLADKDRTKYRLFVQKQPLVATGLMSGQLVMAFFGGIMTLFLVLLALYFFQGLALGLVLRFMGGHG
jgi:hypothetical protein